MTGAPRESIGDSPGEFSIGCTGGGAVHREPTQLAAI